jgi:DNA polymerase III delta prime subunit
MLDIHQYDPHTPKTIDEIVGNREIWTTLAKSMRENTCPHIILAGPAGCGKSLFIRLVLEKERHRPILNINCTANSGLRDLRDTIRGFARGSCTNAGDFRWIVLEHADMLTADTQAFLRRMMETTVNSTRFLFACQDAGAIAEPILSRSSLYTVQSPDPTEIRYEVLRRTEYTIPVETIETLIKQKGSNMQTILLYALAARWTSNSINDDQHLYDRLLSERPVEGASSEAWIAWAIKAEHTCRQEGLDLRELLQLGWPSNPYITRTVSIQWSRLGGISPRALFFDCVSKVSAEKVA